MSMRTLIIGGSGFVSGTLARRAVAAGHQVWVLTRGQRPLPDGVSTLVADRRDRGAFARAVAAAGVTWDLAVDCIAYEAEDARQDLEALGPRVGHLVLISTDFVFDPARRWFPQTEANQHYVDSGYGGNKRRCELELLRAAGGNADGGSGMTWTVLRPCHIYGPGSQLGCLPLHGRDPELIGRLRAGEELRLVGGGFFLQQPLYAPDLADLALGCLARPQCRGRIFCAAGPDIVESRAYYQLIADHLSVPLRVAEVPVGETLAQQPQLAPFLCHRIYDLSALRQTGLPVPATPLAEGLRQHVDSLLERQGAA